MKDPGILGRDEEPPGLGLYWAGEAPLGPGSSQSWSSSTLNLSSASKLSLVLEVAGAGRE